MVKTKEDVSGFREAFKMRFVASTDISKKSTALCSIAWLKYPDQTINTDYLHHHGCQDFNLDTPLDSPPSERSLNPPSLSLADWEGRLRVEDWRNTQRVGSIYPLGEETAPVWSRKYYKNISEY